MSSPTQPAPSKVPPRQTEACAVDYLPPVTEPPSGEINLTRQRGIAVTVRRV